MWNILPKEEKELYKKSIQAFASLSEAFSQKNDNIEKLVPVITSKYQEKQFCSCFNGTVEDIGNTAFDVSLKKEINGKTHKFLVGVKTFRYNSSEQKIAQFKKNNKEWETLKHNIKKIAEQAKDINEFNKRSYGSYLELAKEISNLRNLRIDSAINNLRGFEVNNDEANIESIYHVLMPENVDSPNIKVGETKYEKIDIDNIKIFNHKNLNHIYNFDFTDSKHIYKYTDSDSQLLMDFKNEEIVIEQWPVIFRKDPTTDLIKIYESIDENMSTQKVTESYNWKIKIERYSGFNMFYALGSKQGAKRTKQAIKFIESIKGKYNQEFVNKLSIRLIDFCDGSNNHKERSFQREKIRDITRLEAVGVLSDEDFNKLLNIMYRPKNEFYIPIPNSRKFHKEHPNFFGDGVVKFKENSNRIAEGAKERTFNLIFEPSGNVIKSFITQDNGKAIESSKQQSILGEWILRRILQVPDYQPVTQKDLDNMNINTMRLYKLKGEPSNNVHLEFIWVDEE